MPGTDEEKIVKDTDFGLDPVIEQMTYPLIKWPLCQVLLVDDARFPWIMLVPRRAGTEEMIDLDEKDRQTLFAEMMQASEAFSAVIAPDKLNIGALGNIVRQLHVHIIGRFASDPAWPGPVWGHGQAKPYPPHMAGPLCDKLQKALEAKISGT
jgi:diadenosine tetraphosphate (Ap4A) HIT family hydrolase